MEGDKFINIIKEAVESDPLKQFNLKMIGIGSEKVVFETPGSERKIIKINIDEIIHRVAIKLGMQSRNQITESPLESIVEEHKNIRAELEEVFGKEHVLRVGLFRAKIPFAKQTLLNLAEGLSTFQARLNSLPDDTVIEIEALAETQIKAKELVDREKYETVDLSIDLINWRDFSNAIEVSRALQVIRECADTNALAGFEFNSYSPDKLEAVKNVLEKVINYVKKNGTLIDIFGQGNLTIFKNEEGEWDYHLIDTIMPGPSKLWNQNIKDDPDLQLLRHYYQFYYSVNRLGEIFGIKENLNPEDLMYFKGAGIPTTGIVFRD